MNPVRIELVPEVLEDFDLILAHLAKEAVPDPAGCLEEIIRSIGVLEGHPELGRCPAGGRSDLVIRHLSHDYVALYEYVAAIGTVFVLAIRAGRDAGYGYD